MGRSVRSVAVSVLLGALALGCASSRVPIRALDLDGWCRAELPGVTVYTNAKPSVASLAVRNVDDFVHLVSRLVFEEAFVPRRPLQVLLFERDEQFRRFERRPSVPAHAVSADEAFSTAQSLESTRVEILQHELVHAILFNRAGEQYPPWFHEGLAQFMAPVAIRSGIATLGPLPGGGVVMLERAGPLPLDTLLSSTSALQSTRFRTARFYADAWAFVHYGLLSHAMGGPQRSRELLRFVDATAHGEPWREAFEASFEAPLEEIQREFDQHRQRLADAEVSPQVHLRLGTTSRPVSFEEVEEAEMTRRLGEYALNLERTSLAATLFDAVSKTDPTDAAARIGRMRVAMARGELEHAQALWSALPADARETLPAWAAAAELDHARYAALAEDERRAEGTALLARAREGYARVLAEVPDHRRALLGLGDTYLLEPDAADLGPGVAALESAVLAYPRDPELRLALGRLQLRNEDAAAARPHLRFVVGAYPGSDEAREAEDLLEQAARSGI